MRVYQKRIPCKGRSDMFNLIPIGDVHWGTKNCDENKFIETIEYIKNTPNALWLGMGDYCEFISYLDQRRFDAKTIPERFYKDLDNLHLAQAHEMIKMLKPIKDKCIGLLSGNHEISIKDKFNCDVGNYIAANLGVPELGYVAMIQLVFERQPNRMGQRLDIFAAHGAGSGSSDVAPINTLIKKSQDFEADIYLMGHVHKKAVHSRDRLFLSNVPRLMEKKQLFGVTGTFYNTYQEGSRSYGEKSLYSPTPTGVIKIQIQPFRHQTIGRKQIELPIHLHISA